MDRPLPRTFRVATVGLGVLALALLLDLSGGSGAAVPGLNGRIAFQTNAGGPAHLAVVNPDGHGLRDLTTPPDQSGAPAWSPDGTKIAFVGATAGGVHLYVLDFFTGDIQPLITEAGFAESDPAWSPDGAHIAFGRCGGNPAACDVWVVGADGTGAMNLTQSPGSEDGMPAWSPDGTRIAFASNRDGNPDIYVMNADGTLPTRLTDTAEADSAPDWAPDGMKLVFARHIDFDSSAIWTINADGTSPAELGEGDQPAYSPDGTAIAFVRDTGGNLDLYRMNADGTGAAALVASPAGESAPSWQPINPGENSPPTAVAGEDATFTCESEETVPRLDGSASTDPDSSEGTQDDIRMYEWWLDFGQPTEEFFGLGMTFDPLTLPSGTYLFTLQVTDSRGQTDTDEVSITIDDQTPPEVTIELRPTFLWPPNHRMVRIHAEVSASDFCGPVTMPVLRTVNSNEEGDGTGDGHTAPDIQGVDEGTPDFEFFLRAERSGNGTGRIYTVIYEATDMSGNVGPGSAEILVPHDRGRGKNPAAPTPGAGMGKSKGKGKSNGNGHGNGHGNGNGNGNH